MPKIQLLILSLVGAIFVAGCSSVTEMAEGILPDKSVEYKKEKQAGKNLEVPPDLTSSSINNRMSVPNTGQGLSTSYSEYLTNAQLRQGVAGSYNSAVLPEVKDIAVKRDGDTRWLHIDGLPEVVWPKIVDFWQENGILLVEQDPTVGIMRTSWLENRANIKSDFVTNFIRSAFDGLYEAGTRDQYRVRLERSEDSGKTELFLTHFGMEEQIMSGSTGEGEQSVWNPTGRNQELEAEMLRRVMVYLGVADTRAKSQLASKSRRAELRSELVKARTGVSLIVEENFPRSWRLVGLALDRVGFAVEDRNRSKGLYYVRYNDPAADVEDNKGWLSKLNFWSGDEDIDKTHRYQVSLESVDRGTAVLVLNDQGKRDNSKTAERILTLIHEQVK